jgi:hypothetical protein
MNGFGANVGTLVVLFFACLVIWLIVQGIKAEKEERDSSS